MSDWADERARMDAAWAEIGAIVSTLAANNHVREGALMLIRDIHYYMRDQGRCNPSENFSQ